MDAVRDRVTYLFLILLFLPKLKDRNSFPTSSFRTLLKNTCIAGIFVFEGDVNIICLVISRLNFAYLYLITSVVSVVFFFFGFSVVCIFWAGFSTGLTEEDF